MVQYIGLINSTPELLYLPLIYGHHWYLTMPTPWTAQISSHICLLLPVMSHLQTLPACPTISMQAFDSHLLYNAYIHHLLTELGNLLGQFAMQCLTKEIQH
jgi:hypothetical protein